MPAGLPVCLLAHGITSLFGSAHSAADSDVVAAVRACSDFPAVKALAQQRCGTSMSSLQGARVKGEPAAQGRGSAAAEPAASSAGRPAGAGSRSQAQQQGPGAGSSKRLAEGAPPGSEPPAKRQQADVAGSFAGEPHAASGSAQPAAHLQQEPPVDVKEGLAWQPQQQRLQEAVGHLAALEHAQEGQQLRKQMQAMIRVLQLLGLEPEIWAVSTAVFVLAMQMELAGLLHALPVGAHQPAWRVRQATTIACLATLSPLAGLH